MKVLKIFLTIIIMITFILVGTPIKYNCFELNLAIILIGIIFGIYKIIIKKEKLINTKIDLVVLMFYLSPIIPIIFGTCNSLEETLIFLVRNISLFNIYCMVKDVITKDTKQGDLLINVLIAGGVLLVLLGIDERLSQTVFQYAKYIGLPNIRNNEARMFSTLGYANSFAIIMAIEVFLCFKKLKNNKAIYSGLIYLFLLGIFLSYSRSVLLLFILTFLIYIILLKKKRIYVIYNFFQNVIITVFSTKIFETLYKNNQDILAWISIIIFFILSILFAKIISKNYRKICRIKLKTYVVISIILVIFVIIAYFIGKQFDIPLNIFNYQKSSEEVAYKLYDVEKEKEYCFKFKINAKVKNGTDYPVYLIKIVEENKYYDCVNIHTISFSEFEGEKEIKFTTSNDTVAMVICFNSNNPECQNGLTVNSLYINNEKYELNYLYLPTQLVKRIESFNINNKSLWERFVFFKDSIKIIEDNILFGCGAKGWLYNYKDVQSYMYTSTEVHNYVLQIFIENGIIGFILLMVIISYAIIKILKRKDITEINIAFILLTLHSTLDFNLSFYLIMLIWLLLFTLCTQKNNNIIYNKSNKIQKNLQILIIILNIAIFCLGIFTYKIKNENEAMLEEIIYLVKANEDNQAIELMRDFNEIKKNKNIIYEKLILIDYANVEDENLQYIYEMIKNQKIIANTRYNINRNEIIKKVIRTSSNKAMVEKFCNIIIEENDLMISNINDKERNRLTQAQVTSYFRAQETIYNLAIEALLEVWEQMHYQ